MLFIIEVFYVFIKLSEREKLFKEDFVLLEIKYFKVCYFCLCNNYINKMSRIYFVVFIFLYIIYFIVLKLLMNIWVFCILLSNNIIISKMYCVK